MIPDEPKTDPSAGEPPPTACVNCGSPEFSGRTKMPVCEPCRVGMVKYPFPMWVKLGAVVVAVLVGCSLTLSRDRISGAMRLKRAEKMVAEQRWEDAYQGYQSVVNKKTSSTDLMLIYAEMSINSGHYEEAASILDALSGRRATEMQAERAKSLDNQLGYLVAPKQPLVPSTGAQYLPSILR